MLTLLTVVGFAVAPVAAVASTEADAGGGEQLDGSDVAVQTNESGPFPEEICTDLQGMIHEQAPYDMLIWVDDLPEEFQTVPGRENLPEQVRPPGVPWSVVTPRAIGGIVVGATPNQCDVVDPNDPPFDPRQEGDNVDPDAGGDVQQGDEGEVLVIVNGTLDQTSEGPSGVAEADLELTENGTLDPSATLNDGEKDYGVDPGLQYWSDGTTYFETDVYVFGSRFGGEMDCFGEECNVSPRGLPTFFDPPGIPSHTDRERPGGSGGDGTNGSDDGTDGGTENGTGGTDGGTTDGTGTTGSDGSGSDANGTTDTPDAGGDGSSDGGESGTTDGGEADSGGSGGGDGGDGQNGGGDGNDGGDETTGDADNQQQANADDGNEGAQQAAAADGSGLGVAVAMIVFVLGAAAIAPRD